MEEGTTGEHVAAAIRNGTFTGEKAQFLIGQKLRDLFFAAGGRRRRYRELLSPRCRIPRVSVCVCASQHDTAMFNFSSLLFLHAATRESQYGSKPFEQTLSVDLCGTAGKPPPSSLTVGQRSEFTEAYCRHTEKGGSFYGIILTFSRET